MIEIKRNAESNSKYLEMSKRELIEIIVSQQVEEMRMLKQIEHLKGILEDDLEDVIVVEGGMAMGKPEEAPTKPVKASKQGGKALKGKKDE